MKKKGIFQKNNSRKIALVRKTPSLKMPILLAIASIYTTNANALPQGPSVATGSVDIVNNNAGMAIRQTTDKAIINWQQFGIASGETVNFIQPSSSSLILNRVTGLSSSLINGRLDANGQVFIINPNGVLLGEGAQINVGGIVASTLGISDKDFMDGNFKFSRNSNLPTSVKNLGAVTATEGGYIVFLSDEVKNNGDMNASGGRVLMGAGDQVAIYFAKNSLISYAINRETANALVENAGNIRAAGGTISLVANGIDGLSRNAVVNNTGIIEAKTLRNVKGKIELFADSQSGVVNLNGTLDASASDGPGGTIHASAAHVSTSADAVFTTQASNGKTGLLTIRTANGQIGDNPENIHTDTLSRNLSTTNITVSVHANSQAESGNLVINDAILSNGQNKLFLEAEKNVLINAPLAIGTGGLKIRTDVNGTSSGVLSFGQAGKLNAANNADIDIYTNVESFKNNNIYENFITSPYRLWMLVNNVNQLQKINENLSGNYAIGRDIDAKETALWNQGAGYLPRNIWDYNTGFIPLAFNDVKQFSGKLDGLNHVISNLYINRPIGSKIGLFSSSTGEIKNLGLVDVNITGNDSVGAIAGLNNGNIHNVFVTGSVSINVKPGYSEIASNSAGGIVGKNGILGEIKNAYSLAAVAGSFFSSRLGGIAGANEGKIDSVYTVWNNSKNGITGMNNGKITNAYYTTDGKGQTDALVYDPGNGSTYAENGQLNASALKNAKLNFDFDDTWTRYDGYTFPLLKSFLKPLEILSVDANVTKAYDGVAVRLQPKLLYSDLSAVDSKHLYSTSDPNFDSLTNVGEISYNNQKKFWSDQQGYYLENPIIDQQASIKIFARPILVEAIPESKQFDESITSSLAPQISKNYNSGNMGLVEGDVMTARQTFDSNAPGSRTLQVGEVQIANAEGKNVTANYQIVKSSSTGLIREKQPPQDPGSTPSNPSDKPDPVSPTTPPVDPVDPGKPAGNTDSPVPNDSTASSGGAAGKGAVGEGKVSDEPGGKGTNSGNNNNTADAGNQNNSGTPLSDSSQINRDSKLENFFAWANVDKDEEYRTRLKTRNKNTVSLSLENNGMNLPIELHDKE